MGYTLRIGEFVVSGTELTVESVRHDDAPAFDEPTDYTNDRWPSYTAWWGFVRECGLDALFKNELLAEHPGVCPLRPEHLQAFERVNRRNLDEFDRNRLTWLIYWTRWALANCKKPTFYNS